MLRRSRPLIDAAGGAGRGNDRALHCAGPSRSRCGVRPRRGDLQTRRRIVGRRSLERQARRTLPRALAPEPPGFAARRSRSSNAGGVDDRDAAPPAPHRPARPRPAAQEPALVLVLGRAPTVEQGDRMRALPAGTASAASSSAPKATPGATSSATPRAERSASSARRPSVACGETTLPYGKTTTCAEPPRCSRAQALVVGLRRAATGSAPRASGARACATSASSTRGTTTTSTKVSAQQVDPRRGRSAAAGLAVGLAHRRERGDVGQARCPRAATPARARSRRWRAPPRA